MTNERKIPEPGTRWAYAYELDPPLPEDRLQAVEDLLVGEHEVARSGARTWASRLVLEERVTHILVVSDTPDQDLKANRRLKQKLRDLDVGFSLIAPTPVGDDRGRSSGDPK